MKRTVDKLVHNVQKRGYPSRFLFDNFAFGFSIYVLPILIEILHSAKTQKREENRQLTILSMRTEECYFCIEVT